MQRSRRSLLFLGTALFSLTILNAGAWGQSSAVDPDFAPVVARVPTTTPFSHAPGPLFLRNEGQLIQPDDKLVIWGRGFVIDDKPKGTIARLNPNGTVDHTFNYCACLLRTVVSVALQADGKFLIAGEDEMLRAKVVRLNAGGSRDSSYVWRVPAIANVFTQARVRAVLPDGKALIEVAVIRSKADKASFRIYRVNTDGSRDTSFNTVVIADGSRDIVSAGFARAPDGKFYIATMVVYPNYQPVAVRRFHADGTEDAAWPQPTFTGWSFTDISFLAVQPDGALIIAGSFSTVNGVEKKGLARLLPSGSVDPSFTPLPLDRADSVTFLPDGKLIVAASPLANGNFSWLYRLNSNGSLDALLIAGSNFSSFGGLLTAPVIDSAGAILFVARAEGYRDRWFRVLPNGSIDESYNRNIGETGQITAMARQQDGRIIIVGNFNRINGVGRATIARLNTDGSLDPTFDAGTGFNALVTRIALQPDGRVIAIGKFSSVNGVSRRNVARLNADGTLDAGFQPTFSAANTSDTVFALAVQMDGKFLIGGSFSQVNGVSRFALVRFHADGSVDTSFNHRLPPSSIEGIVLTADGKIVIGGFFNRTGSFDRQNIARLNPDGSLDPTFNLVYTSSIRHLFLQPDGRILAVTDGARRITAPTQLMRINTDGSLDSSFDPDFNAVQLKVGHLEDETLIDSVIPRADGSIVVGGHFHAVNGLVRENLVRLRANGSVDASFLPQGTDGRVSAMLAQPDGRVVIGGEFSRVESSIRAGLARISVAPLRVAALFDFDGDGRAGCFGFPAVEQQLVFDPERAAALRRQTNGRKWRRARPGRF